MNNSVCVAKPKRNDVPFVPNGILPIFFFTGEEMKGPAMLYPFFDKHLLSKVDDGAYQRDQFARNTFFEMYTKHEDLSLSFLPTPH